MHLLKTEKDTDVKTNIANLLGHLLKHHITIHEYKRLVRILNIKEDEPSTSGSNILETAR